MISRILKGSAIARLALLMMAPISSAQRGGFHGGFGGGFHGGFRGGFGFGGFWGPGWGWYGYPYDWDWPYGYGYYGGPATGEVKLKAPAKNDQVFVDGAYAGLAKNLKHFYLAAGNHNIELRDPSGHSSLFQERIDVIPGKKIDVSPGH